MSGVQNRTSTSLRPPQVWAISSASLPRSVIVNSTSHARSDPSRHSADHASINSSSLKLAAGSSRSNRVSPASVSPESAAPALVSSAASPPLSGVSLASSEDADCSGAPRRPSPSTVVELHATAINARIRSAIEDAAFRRNMSTVCPSVGSNRLRVMRPNRVRLAVAGMLER